mgnify:FL=1
MLYFLYVKRRKEYVTSLSLQRCEMRQMEADHQNQLEGISLELMHFESSLRTKENQIDTMLATKDQVLTFYHIFLSIQYKICTNAYTASTKS